jgi:ribonuclease HI
MDNLCGRFIHEEKRWLKGSDKNLSGEQLCNSLRLEFKVTNNKAEYEAVIARLRIAQEMGLEYVEIRSDS